MSALDITFGAGKHARLVAGADYRAAPGLVAELGLAPPPDGRPVIVVCGGADGLTGDALDRARAVVEQAIAPVAGRLGAAVVDGGTAAGVMALTGDVRSSQPQDLPVLVGVAPDGLVSYPGSAEVRSVQASGAEVSGAEASGVRVSGAEASGAEAGDSRAALDAGHSHFILAASDQWGGETRLMMAVAAALAGPGPVAMVVLGGGAVARSEIAHAGERGWPVFAVAGTGGTADWAAGSAPRRFGRSGRFGGRRSGGRPDGVRRVGDAASCARDLSWELHDDAALKDAWRQFATYDQQATRLRATFTRLLGLTLALAVLATVVAGAYTQAGGAALHWAAVVIPALSSILILISGRRAFGQRWVLMRGAAESVKAEIYRHRTASVSLPPVSVGNSAASPAADPAGSPDASQRRLLARLDAIEQQLMLTAASREPLRAYQGPLPPASAGGGSDDGLGALDPDRYLRIRVQDQIGYYERRARQLNRRRNALYVLAFLAGAVGTVLAAAHRDPWVGVTAAMSAGALAYLGYLQFDSTIVGYNQTATKLRSLVRQWRALRPSQRGAAFERLVTESELVLATEVAGWVKHQTDALADTGTPSDQ